ncbi:MAG: ABC transporter permease, partial [Rhodobacteraceae bacterium]|nr:ABC transporter permease [Paracoccaceae bacterium]
MTLVFLALLLWATAWFVNVKLADSAQAQRRSIRLLVPTIFGLTIILVWELTVRGLGVPLVILPPPSLVVQTASENLPILWKDFVQTFLKGALRGYVIGCAS